MMRGLEHISYKERLSELGLDRSVYRRENSDRISLICINISNRCKEEGTRLFSVVSSNKTRRNHSGKKGVREN